MWDVSNKFFFIITSLTAFWALLCAWSSNPKGGEVSASSSDWAEALWLSLAGLSFYSGWLSVILASLNRFSLINIGLAQALLSLILWMKTRVFRPRFKTPTACEVTLGLLLLVCSFFYFRPHEYVLGGTDAGTYVNMSATISKTGGLLPQGQWYKFLSDNKSLVFRQEGFQTKVPSQIQFVGWYSNQKKPEQLIPQFLPFHPALLAIGFSLFGLYGALYVTPLWSLLGVGAVYFFSRKLVGPLLGLVAAFLFAITPVQMYFSRYPTTEPLTVLLVFTGLLAFLNLFDDRRAPIKWGLVGGASLGLALLVRVDLPLLIILSFTALIFLWLRGYWSRGWTAFYLSFSLLFLHFLIHAALFSKEYVLGSYLGGFDRIVKPALTNPVLQGIFLSSLLVIVVFRKTNRALFKKIFSETNFRWLLMVGAAGLSLFAYFIRPELESITYTVSWPSGNRFPIMNGENWVRLGWYLTPLGLILATAGFMGLSHREPLARWGFFLILGTLTTIQYIYNIMIPPYHIYAMRRYLPIVIPTLILFSALALLYIWRSKRYPWNKSVAVLLFLSLAGGLLYQSRNIFYHRDYPEMVQQINALNQKVRPGALLIIAESDEHIFGDKIGPPLHFIFDHPVATIRRDGPRIDAFLQSLNQLAQTQNRPVQLLAYEPLAGGIADHLDLKPVFMYPLRLSSLQNTYYNYPGAVEKEVLPIELYDAELFSSQKFPSAQKVTIDLGAFDAPYIRHGFYGKESIPGFPSLRWTKEQAGLYIPLRRTGGDHLLISIRAATFRPRKLEAAPVTVILAGETVGTFIPDEQWRTFTFQTRPPASGENTLLEFKTGSFNPARLRINADGRDLGFLLDWITLERTKP